MQEVRAARGRSAIPEGSRAAGLEEPGAARTYQSPGRAQEAAAEQGHHNASPGARCHHGPAGVLRDGGVERAKPSPGRSRPGTTNLRQPTGYKESGRRGRASSASAFPVAVPIEARWQQGHSVSLGARGEPRSRQHYGMLAGLPRVGGLPPPRLLLFLLRVSPALSSSRSVSKQFPSGWGRPSFIGLALGAKILLSRGRFLLSELPSLPGGSFFSCHGIPLPPPAADWSRGADRLGKSQ